MNEGEFSGMSQGRNLDSDDDLDLDFMDKKSSMLYICFICFIIKLKDNVNN